MHVFDVPVFHEGAWTTVPCAVRLDEVAAIFVQKLVSGAGGVRYYEVLVRFRGHDGYSTLSLLRDDYSKLVDTWRAST